MPPALSLSLATTTSGPPKNCCACSLEVGSCSGLEDIRVHPRRVSREHSGALTASVLPVVGPYCATIAIYYRAVHHTRAASQPSSQKSNRQSSRYRDMS